MKPSPYINTAHMSSEEVNEENSDGQTTLRAVFFSIRIDFNRFVFLAHTHVCMIIRHYMCCGAIGFDSRFESSLIYAQLYSPIAGMSNKLKYAIIQFLNIH